MVALRPIFKTPKPAPEPSPLSYPFTLAHETVQTISHGQSTAFSCTLKAQAAQQAHQEAIWEDLLAALTKERAYRLQDLDLSVRVSERTSRHRLTCLPMVRLAAFFRHVPNLLHLDLEGNEIGTRGAVALADALQHTPRLQYLNLSGNKIGDHGMQAIAGAFQRGCCPELECLDLTECNVKSVGSQEEGGQRVVEQRDSR